MRQFIITMLIIVLIFVFQIHCKEQKQNISGPQYKEAVKNNKTVYRLAVHPLHNPRKLSAAYQPLINYLNSHFKNIQFKLEASRNYQAYEKKFRKRKAEFLLPNPWQTLEAIKVGYHVIAMAGNAEDFKGIFIIRKDSSIKKPIDLKGKIVSYPSHTALAACIIPQKYLHDAGIDVNNDITNIYVGSQESSILNVLVKKSSVGATWPPPWRLFKKDRPRDAAKLKIIWETPYLINNSVMARNDVPLEITKKVSSLLYKLDQSKVGKSVLSAMETNKFYPADDKSYDIVTEYIKLFEKAVRPVETP